MAKMSPSGLLKGGSKIAGSSKHDEMNWSGMGKSHGGGKMKSTPATHRSADFGFSATAKKL